ncbi:MAG: hypothetical protein J6X18_11230 [Bacteroidales bacterium]|nr:hypothetical protein [Bacteroidales bacterium]
MAQSLAPIYIHHASHIAIYLSQPFRLFLASSIGEAFDGGKSPKGSDRYSLRRRRRIGSCASTIMSLKGSDIFHYSSKI